MADNTVLIRNLPLKTEFSADDCTVVDDGVTTSKISLGTIQEQIRASVHESTKKNVDTQLETYSTELQAQFKTQDDKVTKQLIAQNTAIDEQLKAQNETITKQLEAQDTKVENNLTTLDKKVQDAITTMKTDVANEIKAFTLPLVVRGGKLCCITKEIE